MCNLNLIVNKSISGNPIQHGPKWYSRLILMNISPVAFWLIHPDFLPPGRDLNWIELWRMNFYSAIINDLLWALWTLILIEPRLLIHFNFHYSIILKTHRILNHILPYMSKRSIDLVALEITWYVLRLLALDKYNIIPHLFSKKSWHFYTISSVGMGTCWVLRSRLIYFWRNNNIHCSFYFPKLTLIHTQYSTVVYGTLWRWCCSQNTS